MFDEEEMSKAKNTPPPLNKSHNNTKRWRAAKILGLIVGLPCALYFTACSHIVSWKQETLLNTGEMIVIDRRARFSYQPSGITNAFVFSYEPVKNRHIYFDYNGRSYHYYGDLDLLLLAISPEGTPVLVARSPKIWSQEGDEYRPCTYYAQLTPDAKGEKWHLSTIDKWVYGVASNINDDLGYEWLKETKKIPWRHTAFYFSRRVHDDYLKKIDRNSEEECLSILKIKE